MLSSPVHTSNECDTIFDGTNSHQLTCAELLRNIRSKTQPCDITIRRAQFVFPDDLTANICLGFL